MELLYLLWSILWIKIVNGSSFYDILYVEVIKIMKDGKKSKALSRVRRPLEFVQENAGYFQPKIKSREEMIQKLEKYFLNTPPDQWKLSDVSLACGLSQRTFVGTYGKNAEYADLVDRAKTLVASSYEGILKQAGISHSGSIFALKQLGWVDGRAVMHGVDGENGQIQLSITQYYDPDKPKESNDEG